MYFNPRSHEGSDFDTSEEIKEKYDFNPRSHDGSDLFHGIPLFDTDISIHAPTRGATPVGAGRNQATGISIHAPTRGATASCQFGDPDRAISIHAPTRGATCPPDLCSHLQGISIHAPTRGATSMSLTQICIRSYFNPRSHEGSDVALNI